MPTRAELMGALRRADAEGAEDDARQLARMISELPEESAPEREKSFSLGVAEGFTKPVANLDKMIGNIAGQVGIDTGADERFANRENYLANPEKNDPLANLLDWRGKAPGPWGKIGGEVASTLPLAALTRSPALLGGLTGGLTTENPDDLGQTVMDTGLGAIFGKATDAGLRKVGEFIKEPIKNASSKAAEYVTRLMEGSKKTLADVLASADDKPRTVAEAIGRQGITGLSALGRREGETGDALEGFLVNRAQGAPGRILSDVENASGVSPEAARGDIKEIVEQGREKVSPLFKAALEGKGAVWNTELQELASRPSISEAIKREFKSLRDAGKNPAEYGLEIDEMMGGVPGTEKLQPTAEAWDRVRKAMGRMIERDPFGKPLPDSQHAGNFDVNTALRDLSTSLKKAIPGYDKALGQSAEYLSAESAFKNGADFLTNNKIRSEDIIPRLASMAPAEKEAFKGGVVDAIMYQAKRGRLNIKSLLTPEARDKLDAVFGRDQSRWLVSQIKKEVELSKTGSKMMPGGGSHTQELNEAMRVQDNQSGLSKAMLGIGSNLASGKSVTHSITDFLSGKGKDLLAWHATRGMPVPVRDEAGKLLMADPAELANFIARIQNQRQKVSPLARAIGSGLQIAARPAGVGAATGASAVTNQLLGQGQ